MRVRAESIALALSLAACTPGAPARAVTGGAPSLAGSELCRRGRMNPSPLVVQWSPTERAQFEGLAQRGLIVARYTGCELQVLTQCQGPGGYRYAPVTPKQEVEEIKGADELYAKMPIGAAHLEGTLRQSGELVIDSTIVGRLSAEKIDARERDLAGRCLGATHVVSGLTVGAFELSSGSRGSVGGSIDVMQFGSGRIDSKTTHNVLSHDGDAASCASATVDGPPPPGCRALLRIDLAPLPEAEARFMEEEKARDDDLVERQASASRRRTAGYILAGVGVGLGALAGTFAGLGAAQNSRIEDGGLKDAEAMKDVESTGKTYNGLAYGFGIASVVGIGLGVPLVLFSPRPERLDDAFLTPRRRFVGAR